jgi:hypothetical protein
MLLSRSVATALGILQISLVLVELDLWLLEVGTGSKVISAAFFIKLTAQLRMVDFFRANPPNCHVQVKSQTF